MVKFIPRLTSPLVTVGLPVFNGEEFLADAIESILSQSIRNLELLIINDASTDGSPSIITKYADIDHRVRVINNSKNQGLVSARNAILHEARGTYLAWNDQDDVSLPHRLAVQTRYMRKNDDICVSGAWSMYQECSGPKLRMKVRKRYLPTTVPDINASMLFHNAVSFNTVMMSLVNTSREDFEFSQDAGMALDYELWTRVMQAGGIANIPVFVSKLRKHPAQASSRTHKDEIAFVSKRIRAQLLKSTLNIENTEILETHEKLSETMAQDLGALSPRLVESHLRLICDMNERVGYFDALALKKTLGTRWFLFMARKSKTNPRVLGQFLTSPLSFWVAPAARRYFIWRLRGLLA